MGVARTAAPGSHSPVLGRLARDDRVAEGKTVVAGDRSQAVGGELSGGADEHLESVEGVQESTSARRLDRILPCCTEEGVAVVAGLAEDEAASAALGKYCPGDAKDCRCYTLVVSPQAAGRTAYIQQVAVVEAESPLP